MKTTPSVWIGKAFCTVALDHAQFQSGNRGAIVVFACQAVDIVDCCRQIASELAEHGLILKGFDHLIEQEHLDREVSQYEKELVHRLESYPVQFQDVHYFKADA